jgi:RNA polymerase sigma-70 factor (ECF subfamily)
VDPDAALFRREAARLLAILTRTLGIEHLALAEDVVQETLSRAFEAWTYSGIPEHYSALLTAAAKNRAIDAFRRESTARKFAPELRRLIESEWTLRPAAEELFLPDALRDDELRMMFSCCNPRLHQDVRVALVLNILCGFGVDEIASAFLVTPSAMEKRLSKGKKVLAESRNLFELTAADFEPRLSAVHRAIYLLFSEGYHGACVEAVIRVDLCQEALRLVRLLVGHHSSATPTTHALAALMCLHAARLPGRADEAGRLRPFVDQDRSRWDTILLAEGFVHLDRSATGGRVSEYHVEAGIAALHASAASMKETNWAEIVRLYDVLMKISPSPVVALNRAMAMAEYEGPERGLAEIAMIADADRLAAYPFYPAAVAELELRLARPLVARKYFQRAKDLARNEGERRFVDQRLEECARLSTS